MKNHIGIIRRSVTHGDDLIVLSRREYDRLTLHLKELRDALAKIRRGESELRLGKTKIVSSLRELL